MFSTLIESELEGYQIVLDYEEGGNQKISMDFLRIFAGEDIERVFMKEESVWVVLSGMFKWELSDGKSACMKRKSLFDDKPEAIYIPPESIIKIRADADSEIAILRSRTDQKHPSMFAPANSVSEKVVGEDGWMHVTRNIIGEALPVSNLFVGEIILSEQRWAEFPPVLYEDSERIFLFRTNKEGCMGLFYSFSGEEFDEKEAAVIENNTVILTSGYHTFTVAPGCSLYALYGISSSDRNLKKKTEKRCKVLLSV